MLSKRLQRMKTLLDLFCKEEFAVLNDLDDFLYLSSGYRDITERRLYIGDL